MRKVIIDPEIFVQFPDFKRGIIVVKDIENALGNKRIKKPLNKEIEKRIKEDLIEHPFVKAWDEAHLKFGSNPNKFPPSIKSLLKRIKKGGGFPFINSVVALFNYISIKYLIPCGGDDVDRIEGNLHLGFAKGDECFIPLGGEDEEHPQPGEVIYFDDKRKYIVRASRGAVFHTDKGVIRLEDLIGSPYGSTHRTSIGIKYLVLKPLLVDIVLHGFKRKTQ